MGTWAEIQAWSQDTKKTSGKEKCPFLVHNEAQNETQSYYMKSGRAAGGCSCKSHYNEAGAP